jgi:ABC-2 type transport system permease protein
MSHVLNAGLGAVGLLLVFAVAMGLAAGWVLGDTLAQLRALIGAGVVQLPAVMVLGAVVIALIAWMPRWAGPVSWAMLMLSVLVGPMFGAATMQLPQWVQDASPFTHIPKVPAVAVTALPIVALVAIAGALAVAGLLSFRHRNLSLPT